MDVFGFRVRRVPVKMEEDLPSRFKNRLYLINEVADDEVGTHTLNIHSAHMESTVEKGVLMMILAFAFCKGTSQVRSGQMKGAGKKTRWISEHHLYSLLHRVDENIPSEPPSVEGKKRSRQSSSGGRKSLSPGDIGPEGVGQTPDIDVLLERFVQMDYLLRDKIEEPDSRESSFAGEDGKVVAYAMGPRAAMEVGRKQIIYFCSNVLDEQPDPTMLAEVEEDEESEEEEEEEEHRLSWGRWLCSGSRRRRYAFARCSAGSGVQSQHHRQQQLSISDAHQTVQPPAQKYVTGNHDVIMGQHPNQLMAHAG